MCRVDNPGALINFQKIPSSVFIRAKAEVEVGNIKIHDYI